MGVPDPIRLKIERQGGQGSNKCHIQTPRFTDPGQPIMPRLKPFSATHRPELLADSGGGETGRRGLAYRLIRDIQSIDGRGLSSLLRQRKPHG